MSHELDKQSLTKKQRSSGSQNSCSEPGGGKGFAYLISSDLAYIGLGFTGLLEIQLNFTVIIDLAHASQHPRKELKYQ